LLHKDGASDGHALDEVVLVEGVVDQALDGVREIVDGLREVTEEAHR